jgi:hypothetical protein
MDTAIKVTANPAMATPLRGKVNQALRRMLRLAHITPTGQLLHRRQKLTRSCNNLQLLQTKAVSHMRRAHT